MFRNFFRSLEPFRNYLYRSAADGGAGAGVGAGAGAGAGEGTTSAFSRNSVTKEQQLSEALRRKLPGITYVSVQDISGGCGAMFEISVEATEFAGLPRVQQHRLVTDSLRKEIADMHGVRINTTPPPGAGNTNTATTPPPTAGNTNTAPTTPPTKPPPDK